MDDVRCTCKMYLYVLYLNHARLGWVYLRIKVMYLIREIATSRQDLWCLLMWFEYAPLYMLTRWHELTLAWWNVRSLFFFVGLLACWELWLHDPQDKTTYTLPETNSSHLKIDGWNTTFLLGWPIFRGYLSFREGMSYVSPGVTNSAIIGLLVGKPNTGRLWNRRELHLESYWNCLKNIWRIAHRCPQVPIFPPKFQRLQKVNTH